MESQNHNSPNPAQQTAPVALTRTQRIVRLAKRTIRYGAWSLLGLLVALALALGTLWYWSASDSSLNTMLQILQRHMPAGSSLQTEGVRGSLRRGGHIDKLIYRMYDPAAGESTGTMTISLDNVDIVWSLFSLRDSSTRLRRLSIHQLTYDDSRPSKAASHTQPLQELVLPVGIDVPFEVDIINIVSQSGQVQALSQLKGRYRYDRSAARHSLIVDTLHNAFGSYQLKVSLGGHAPMPLQLQGNSQLFFGGQSSTPKQTLQAQLNADGTLSGAEAILQFSGEIRPLIASKTNLSTDEKNSWIKLQAVVHPWRQQMISRAQARWTNTNLQDFWPEGPRTDLQGSLQLQPQKNSHIASTIAPNAKPETQAQPGPLDFLGENWRVLLQASNTEAGPWDQQLLPLHALTSELSYDHGTLTLDAFDWQLAAQKNHITAHAKYLPSQGWQGQLALEQIDLAAIYSTIKADPLQGTVRINSKTVSATTSKQMPINFEAMLKSASSSRTELLNFDEISLQGQWQTQSAQLTKILVRSRGGTLQGNAGYDGARQFIQTDLKLRLPGGNGLLKGQLSPASGQGKMQLNIHDLRQTSRWLQLWPGMQSLRTRQMGGTIQLQGDWRGGWQSNDTQLHALLQTPLITARSISTSDTAPLTLKNARLTLQGRLSDARLDAQTDIQRGHRALHIALQGNGGKRDHRWQAQLQSLQARLQDMLQKRELQAELAAPVAFALEQKNNQLQLQASAFQILLRDNAAASQQTSIQVGPLQWRRQAGNHFISSNGHIKALPVIWLEALSPSTVLGQTLSGNMLLDGQWSIELGQHLRINASLARSSGDIIVLTGSPTVSAQGRVAAGTRVARVDIQGTDNNVQASLVWDSAQAGNARATVRTRLQREDSGWSLANDAPLQGQLQAKLPQVGVWNLFAPPGWRLRGTLNTNISIGGTLQSPHLQGVLNADDLGARSIVDGIAFSKGRLRARLNGQRIDVDEFSLQGAPNRSGLLQTKQTDGGTVSIAGSAQWAYGSQSLLQSINVQLTGKFNQLQLFTMPDRLIVLSGDVTAGLDNMQLTVRGALHVDRALIELPNESEPQLGSDVIVLPSKKHPRAVISRPVQQTASAGNSTSTPALDSDIVVKHQTKSTSLTNNDTKTSAAHGPFPKPAAARIVPHRQASATNMASTTNLRPSQQIKADIKVGIDLGSDFRVRGFGLDTRINGKLTVEGGPTITDMPRLTGTVQTDRGSFRAYGQNLQIESGRIVFSGVINNPAIDIVAVRSNIDIRVGVRIYGNAQQPIVQLFSEPSMPDSERLSWLVLGHSSYSATDTALLQQAAVALLSGDGRNITERLADTLGLDQVTFKGSDSGVSGSSVLLGKRFSENFYLAYEKGLDATVGTLYFFFDLSRTLKLRAETGQQSALELIYTLSYD